MREAVEKLFKFQRKGLNQLIRFSKKKGRIFFNHVSFFKNAEPCYNNPKQENFIDSNVLIPLNGNPSGVIVDEMMKSNESVKVAVIEGSNANVYAFKIAQEKVSFKNKMGTKDPHRTTNADFLLQMVLFDEVVVEVDEF